MHILQFNVDEAQELIASGDHRRHQQIWIEKDGEVRLVDPTGLSPSEIADTVYARSNIFAATDNNPDSYVGKDAANDPRWMRDILTGLVEAQNAHRENRSPLSSSGFWI